MDNIKSFLKEANYEIRVTSYGDYCIATFPEKLEQPKQEALEVRYDLNILDKTNKRYAVRPIILIAISRIALLRNYNPLLISFYYKDDEQEIDENLFLATLNIELSDEEIEKEGLLRQFIEQGYEKGFDTIIQDAENAGLKEEIILINNLIGEFVQ